MPDCSRVKINYHGLSWSPSPVYSCSVFVIESAQIIPSVNLKQLERSYDINKNAEHTNRLH